MDTRRSKTQNLLLLPRFTGANPRGDVLLGARAGGRRAPSPSRGRSRTSRILVRRSERRGRSVDSVNTGADLEEGEPDWDEPTWPGPPAPPSLPTGGLPDWIRAHVESVSAATQTPPGMAVMFALAGLSTALANKGLVEIRSGWTEPLHVWTMSVLEPANRKSRVLKLMLDPVWAYEADRAEAVRSERREAVRKQEILQNALARVKKTLTRAIADGKSSEEISESRERLDKIRGDLAQHEVPDPERLVADDITGEALGQLMAENHGRAAILSAEGEIFRNMTGRYGDKPVFNVFKKSWTGDERLRDDRVTREGSRIERPALTLGLGVQPELLRSLVEKKSLRGEGLFGRFLVVQPESPVGHRKTGDDVPGLDAEAKECYERNLRALLQTSPAGENDGQWVPHRLPLSEEARTELFDFEDRTEERLRLELDTLKDWAGKLVGNTARVAGLLHLAGRVGEDDLWAAPVSSEAITAAVRLSRQLIPHAKTAFAAMSLDPEVRRERYVLRRIQEADNPDTLTVREVHRLCSGKGWVEKAEDVKGVLRRLEKYHLVQIEHRSSSNGRRPSPWVRVHPELRAEIDRTDRTPLAP